MFFIISQTRALPRRFLLPLPPLLPLLLLILLLILLLSGPPYAYAYGEGTVVLIGFGDLMGCGSDYDLLFYDLSWYDNCPQSVTAGRYDTQFYDPQWYDIP